jgi:uncharacterized protein YlxP (DUF503 family)
MSSGFVGIACLDVRLPGGATLKDRRSALAHLRRDLAERFGAAVAEVGDLDTPWHGRLTAALVRQTQSECQARLQAIEDWATEQPHAVEVRQVRIVTPEDLA